MEQRRRKSFFGNDAGGGELPVLSPGGIRRQKAKKKLWRTMALFVVLLVLVGAGVYFVAFAPAAKDDHQAMLDRLKKMTPEELRQHRMERLEKHKSSVGKLNDHTPPPPPPRKRHIPANLGEASGDGTQNSSNRNGRPPIRPNDRRRSRRESREKERERARSARQNRDNSGAEPRDPGAFALSKSISSTHIFAIATPGV